MTSVPAFLPTGDIPELELVAIAIESRAVYRGVTTEWLSQLAVDEVKSAGETSSWLSLLCRCGVVSLLNRCVCVVWDSRLSDFSGRVTKSGKVAGSLASWSRGQKPLKPGMSHNHSRVIWFPEIEY